MAIRSDFTAGEILSAVDLNDTFAAKLNRAGGKILQTVQATYSTETTIASTTMTDTGLTASITPTSTANKILVITNQVLSVFGQAQVRIGSIQLLRSSTVIASQVRSHNMGVGLSGYASSNSPMPFVFLDSPATASAVTYKTQAKVDTTANDSGVVAQASSSLATITLLEISA